jgi:hypothetical protein
MSADTEVRFAAALEKIAEAVTLQAETNASLAKEMRVLTTAIRGAHELVVKNTDRNVEEANRRNADMKRLSEQFMKREGNGPRGQTP